MNKNNILKVCMAFSIVAIIIYISSILPLENTRVLGMDFLLALFIIFIIDYKKGMYTKIIKLIPIIATSLIVAYISQFNIYLGLVLSLIWIATMLYISFVNFKTEVYLPLLFIYLVSLIYNNGVTHILPNYFAIISAIVVGIIIKIIINRIQIRNDKSKKIDNIFEFTMLRSSKKFKINYEKLNFAIKIAVLVSIVYFIITVFKLDHENWLLFGVIGITYPYEKLNGKLTKNLLLGSLFGSLRILIIVSVAPIYSVRIGVLGMGFYLFMTSKKPRVRAMGGMMFALSMTETLSYFNGINLYVLMQRIIFVLIAFIVSIAFTKLVSLYNSRKFLKEAY